MVLMESYLGYCSVRLGVIIISIFAVLKGIIVLYFYINNGAAFMFKLIVVFGNEAHIESMYGLKDTINWVEQFPQTVLWLMLVYNIAHLVVCVEAVYGAYWLKKWHVLPLTIFEFLYLMEVSIGAWLFISIVKQHLDIRYIILLTLMNSTYVALVVYDCFALIAFIQIVTLVESERYKECYGEDPFNPTLNPLIFGSPIKVNVQELGLEHPNIFYVKPKAEQELPKWWQIEYQEDEIPQKDMAIDFYRQELLSEVLLRNALNGVYNYGEHLGK